MLFELQLNLCNRFPNLTPFDIRKETFEEVILLVERLNSHLNNKNVNKNSVNKKHYEKIGGKLRVYVPVAE